jgi:hypothetical protein
MPLHFRGHPRPGLRGGPNTFDQLVFDLCRYRVPKQFNINYIFSIYRKEIWRLKQIFGIFKSGPFSICFWATYGKVWPCPIHSWIIVRKSKNEKQTRSLEHSHKIVDNFCFKKKVIGPRPSQLKKKASMSETVDKRLRD